MSNMNIPQVGRIPQIPRQVSILDCLDFLHSLETIDPNRSFLLKRMDWSELVAGLEKEGDIATRMLVRSIPYEIFKNTTLSDIPQSIRPPHRMGKANTAVLGPHLEGLKIAFAEGGKDNFGVLVYGFTPNASVSMIQNSRREFTYESEGIINPEDMRFVVMRFPRHNVPESLQGDNDAEFDFFAYKFIPK